MPTYHYTHDDYWYNDQTLTQGLLDQYVSTINPANDSGYHNVKNRTGSGTVVNSVTVTNDYNAVFLWDDGDHTTQHYVGVLAPDTAIEAVGDFDGDGKEDLLLREHISGRGGLGYWSGARAEAWCDMDARIETDTDTSYRILIA